MITGRDLIIYILENHLEDEPIFTDGQFMGFYTAEKFAELYGYGVETVKTWIKMGTIQNAIQIGNTYLIPRGEND